MPDFFPVLPRLDCFLNHNDPFTMIADAARKDVVFLDETGLQLVCSLIDKHDFQREEAIIQLGGKYALSLAGERQYLKHATSLGLSRHEGAEEVEGKTGGTILVVLLFAESQFHYKLIRSIHFDM